MQDAFFLKFFYKQRMIS